MATSVWPPGYKDRVEAVFVEHVLAKRGLTATHHHMPVSCTNTVEVELIEYVERWIALLATDDWPAAMALIEVPNSYGMLWTDTDVKQVLKDYARGHQPKVMDPRQMQEAVRIGILPIQDDAGYLVEYDLPLDGAWSDLTVQFEFHRIGDKFFASLQDLHVL